MLVYGSALSTQYFLRYWKLSGRGGDQLLEELILIGEVEKQKRDNMDLDVGINRSCQRYAY